MTPDAYCRDRAGAAGSNLYYATVFLPPERRGALFALHACAREIRDCVDAPGDAGVAAARLDWWQGELERLCAGAAQHPVTRALQPHVAAFGLTRTRLLHLVEGAREDLAQSRMLDLAALSRHAHLVAGVLAEMTADICAGAAPAPGPRVSPPARPDTPPGSHPHAHRLGEAMHVVSLLRDVGEHARNGRIYLPADELQQHGVKPADLLAGRHTEGFEALMRLQARRARDLFAQALATMPASERRDQRPLLILAALHSSLLVELARERFRVLHQRIALTPIRKFAIAWRTWVLGPPGHLGLTGAQDAGLHPHPGTPAPVRPPTG
jgi:phytoene synthase